MTISYKLYIMHRDYYYQFYIKLVVHLSLHLPRFIRDFSRYTTLLLNFTLSFFRSGTNVSFILSSILQA
jgi:hypothetical protein